MAPPQDDLRALTQEIEFVLYNYSSSSTSDIVCSAAWEAIFRSRFGAMMDGPFAPKSKTRAQTLELELNALERYTILAKRCRNASQGACSLPVEILANIFGFAQIDWRPTHTISHLNGTPANNINYDLGWIYLTHVCHIWRSVSYIVTGCTRILN